MLFDTDIFIWIQRGNEKALRLMESQTERYLSTYTYMELLQGAKEKKQHKYTIDFLKDFEFQILGLSENIGHRAAVYVEEYALSNGIRAGDALIAATAVEHAMTLCTSNQKHFKVLKELRIKIFEPRA